jgi:hypothetical protein
MQLVVIERHVLRRHLGRSGCWLSYEAGGGLDAL